MFLPSLAHWENTRKTLHQSLTPLLLTRLLTVDPLPNALRHGLIVTPTGATTGSLKIGGSLSLDYAQGIIDYHGEKPFSVSLAGHNQTSLIEAVFAQFKAAGHNLEPDMSYAKSAEAFEFDAAHAADYAQVQWRMYTALSRLKAQFLGAQTPLVLWAHGFDISTLWFSHGMDEHTDPHINFGFSPGTPDIGQPYAYFYAWPVPDSLASQLPDMVQWHTAWSTPGGVIPYDTFANTNEPEQVVTETLLQVYQTASALLK